MTTLLQEKLAVVLASLDTQAQSEVLDFAEFLAQKQTKPLSEEATLSEAEYARILGVLDAVADVSVETGPRVSNRDHDADLYGES